MENVILSEAERPESEVTSKPTRRRFAAKYKRRILREVAACTQPGEIGALLRREGLYSSHLAKWRQQAEAGELSGLTPKRRGPKPRPADARDRLSSGRRQRPGKDMGGALMTAARTYGALADQDGRDEMALLEARMLFARGFTRLAVGKVNALADKPGGYVAEDAAVVLQAATGIEHPRFRDPAGLPSVTISSGFSCSCKMGR